MATWLKPVTAIAVAGMVPPLSLGPLGSGGRPSRCRATVVTSADIDRARCEASPSGEEHHGRARLGRDAGSDRAAGVRGRRRPGGDGVLDPGPRRGPVLL